VRKFEAEITLEYESEEVAKAIARAVLPDNFKTPVGLSIETVREKNKVITRIKCKRKLPTFIATIDDLLFCTSTAEKTIQITKRLK
jgi:tRNA threonylcarbamoyladenosine modification (KEOPS) complex  Pcc1 subunit